MVVEPPFGSRPDPASHLLPPFSSPIGLLAGMIIAECKEQTTANYSFINNCLAHYLLSIIPIQPWHTFLNKQASGRLATHELSQRAKIMPHLPVLLPIHYLLELRVKEINPMALRSDTLLSCCLMVGGALSAILFLACWLGQ